MAPTATFSCNNCKYLVLDGVTIKQTQGHGLAYLTDGTGNLSNCSDATHKACFQFLNGAVYDIGGNGMVVGQDLRKPNHDGALADSAVNLSQNFTIRNSVVAFVNQMEPGAYGEGIYVLNAHDYLIVHNDVSDTYHGGIRLGDFYGRDQDDQHGYSFAYNGWV